MKKSELIALIKEEIMSEMDYGMMDDEYSYELPPEGVVDDDTREEMDQTDQIISLARRLAGDGEAAKRLLQKCIGLIDNEEEARLSQYDDDDDDDDMMQEGTLKENFGADADLVIRAIIKLMTSPYTGPMIAAAIASVPFLAVHEKRALEKLKNAPPPVDGGEM